MPQTISEVLRELILDFRSRATTWRDRGRRHLLSDSRDGLRAANQCEFIARELDCVALDLEARVGR
jgi:hypothetical protein